MHTHQQGAAEGELPRETNLFDAIEFALREGNADKKCALTRQIFADFKAGQLSAKTTRPPARCQEPGYPATLKRVAPRELKRRSMRTQEGRCIFIHAIAHIEFNAINLSLDAAYRYRDLPQAFTRDWLSVADDEARHFQLLSEYLEKHNVRYGDFPAHNGLWDMADSTQDDVIARMALVPRVLEARGLDVSPPMIRRLEDIGDADAAARLKQIYIDEIEHVKIGSRWFYYVCNEAGQAPRETFFAMIDRYLHGELKGPFNVPARLKAGFDELELHQIESKYGR